jgi:uncharacterized protein YndB with AHSA1/START domain
MRIEHTIEIDRPVDDVFAFIADPDNLPKWQSGLLEVRRESAASGVGARHLEVRTMLGKRIEQTLEVTAFEPCSRLDLRVVNGPVKLTIGHTFTRLADGTRITVVGEGDPGPLFALGGPIVARAVKRQSRADFGRLKRILEEDLPA